MRTLLVIALAGSLAGCATFNNPLNTSQLYDTEAAYGTALALANGYKKSCIQKVSPIYPTCRTIVPKLQAADRNVQGALAAARNFIRDNPTISAVSLIGAVEKAVTDFTAIESQYGVH